MTIQEIDTNLLQNNYYLPRNLVLIPLKCHYKHQFGIGESIYGNKLLDNSREIKPYLNVFFFFQLYSGYSRTVKT